MNLAIPDLDLIDPAIVDILDRLESIDGSDKVFLYNQLQTHLLHDATVGQVKALAAPFERHLEKYRLTQSVEDRQPDLAERTTRKAKSLLGDSSLGLTHADRALIAGYILTESKEAEEFASRIVNDFLESLGVERIGNITAALSALESQKLLEIVERADKNPQAQKRHRLTTAGYSKASRLLSLRDVA